MTSRDELVKRATELLEWAEDPNATGLYAGTKNSVVILARDVMRRGDETAIDVRLLEAARHLLMAAKGPVGGPTDWNETRARWMAHADRSIAANKEQDKVESLGWGGEG